MVVSEGDKFLSMLVTIAIYGTLLFGYEELFVLIFFYKSVIYVIHIQTESTKEFICRFAFFISVDYKTDTHAVYQVFPQPIVAYINSCRVGIGFSEILV